MSARKPRTRKAPATTVVVLRLYIAGGAPNSLLAIANLEAICREHLKGAHRLEVVDGKLTGRLLGEIVDAHGKAAELVRIRTSLGLTREAVIGMGDGANDLPFLKESGVSIAFRAKPAVREVTTHCLDYVGLDGVLHLFE